MAWLHGLALLLACAFGCSQPAAEPTSKVGRSAAVKPEAEQRGTLEGERDRVEKASEVVLIYSGELRGYIHPCDCTDGMLGGLSRRSVFVEKVRKATAAPVLLVDFGNSIKDGSLQSELKLNAILACYRIIGGERNTIGLGLGPRDLAVGNEALAGQLMNAPDLPFLSANMAVQGVGELLRPFRRVDAAGVQVFVTACVDPELVAGLPGVQAREAVEALRELSSEAEAADLRVLLAHADLETCRAWIRELAFFDVVVGGTDQENPLEPERIGRTTFFCPGIWGKYGLAVALRRSEGGAWAGTVTKEALREEVGEDPRIVEEELRLQKWLVEVDQNPELRKRLHGEPKPHPRGEYAGSARCAECHKKAFEVYERSRHHGALETLRKRGAQVDPECLICHVVGYGYASGFATEKPLPELSGVGCECCHGPGKKHAESSEPADIELGGEENCRICHTAIQSPDFNYVHKFASIAHPEGN